MPSNWPSVNCASAHTCDTTSIAETLTVPSGNPGLIRFTIANGNVGQYSINGGAFTTITLAQVSVTNGQTLTLKLVGLPCGPESDTITVIDKNTNINIGTFTGTNTAGCIDGGP
jgi:hypothetical protein